MICLPKELTQKFLTGLKAGDIDPQKLSDMTSAERHTFFEEFVGKESAAPVNALFESKLLLKDQQAGMISWAKEVGGFKPEVQRDIVAKINKLDTVLNPEQEKAFLADLAAKKLGTEVTIEEANKISELAKTAAEAKAEIPNGGDRLKYGAAVVKLINYADELKKSNKLSIVENIKDKGISKSAGTAVQELAGNAKSLKATLDDSYIAHQGLKMMWTHPTIWARNALASFRNAVRTLGGHEVMDEVHADIVSRPNYMNGSYKKMGLSLGNVEEQFPGSALEKVPGVGRVLKAADVAYTAQAYVSRVDAADLYLKLAEDQGVDIKDPAQLTSIGKMVNSLTGRGNLGRFEPVSDTVNVAFFALRYLKSNWDTLTAHQLQGDVTPFVRKQAAINILKIVAGTAGVLVTANALKPGSVEKDPRSADFGKIKVGNTRFDVSGGMAPIITLAARLLPVLYGGQPSTKSSTTGKITPINSGKFGASSGMSVIGDFFGNKVSPFASLLIDIANQRDRNGKPITFGGETANLLEPLPVANIMEMKNDPNAAPIWAGLILDGLGISANTYSALPKKK